MGQAWEGGKTENSNKTMTLRSITALNLHLLAKSIPVPKITGMFTLKLCIKINN